MASANGTDAGARLSGEPRRRQTLVRGTWTVWRPPSLGLASGTMSPELESVTPELETITPNRGLGELVGWVKLLATVPDELAERNL